MASILVVDDEVIACRRLKTALETAGHEVETCDGGSAAVRRLRERGFDVVVTDIRMDDVDGIQVLHTAQELHPGTRVILITGFATVELAREALAKGATDFIAKPFQPRDLRATIDRCLQERSRTTS